MKTTTRKTIRKGQLFTRKSDGFVFIVKSASRSVPGAYMQCVDATRIFGFYSASEIALSFAAR